MPSLYHLIFENLKEAKEAYSPEECAKIIEGLGVQYDQFVQEHERLAMSPKAVSVIENHLGDITKKWGKNRGFVNLQVELFKERLSFASAAPEEILRRATEDSAAGLSAFEAFERNTTRFSAPVIDGLVSVAFANKSLRAKALDYLASDKAFKTYSGQQPDEFASNWFEKHYDAASMKNAAKLLSLVRHSKGIEQEKPLLILSHLLCANVEVVRTPIIMDLAYLLGSKDTTVKASRCIFGVLKQLFDAMPEMARIKGLSDTVVHAAMMERDVELFTVSDAEPHSYTSLLRKIKDKKPIASMSTLAILLMDDIRNPKLDGLHVADSIDKHRAVVKACPAVMPDDLAEEMAALAAVASDPNTSWRALDYVYELMLDYPKKASLSILQNVSAVEARDDALTRGTAVRVKNLVRTLMPKRRGRKPSFVKAKSEPT